MHVVTRPRELFIGITIIAFFGFMALESLGEEIAKEVFSK